MDPTDRSIINTHVENFAWRPVKQRKCDGRCEEVYTEFHKQTHIKLLSYRFQVNGEL